MDRSARKVRQGLCADALFKLIRERCERLPDARAVPVNISLADAFSANAPHLDDLRAARVHYIIRIFGSMKACPASNFRLIPDDCKVHR